MSDDPHANNLETKHPDANAVQGPTVGTPSPRAPVPTPRSAPSLFASNHPRLHARSQNHVPEPEGEGKPDLTKVTAQGESMNMPQGDVQ